MEVTLLIPTLNEIECMKEIMPRIKRDWVDQILIVDGGSTDGTIEYARKSGYFVLEPKVRGLTNQLFESFRVVKGDIVVFLGAREAEYEEVVLFDLQPVIFDVRQLESLAFFAARKEVKVGVHLKVDTGMGRLGVMPAELEQYAAVVRKEKGLFFAGLMSHFPSADSAEFSSTQEQNKLFGKLSAQIAGSDQTFPVHIANSAAAMRSPDLHWDMVRPGLSLYGCYPSEECLDLVDLKHCHFLLPQILQQQLDQLKH